MLTSIKNHWISSLVGVGIAFLTIIGIIMMISGGADSEASVRVFGVVSSFGALALVAGLWGLATGRSSIGLANMLIIVGLLVLGVGFWWFVFAPPVLALVVLYAGVARSGLAKELRPT